MKEVYNINSKEKFSEAKLFGGNPMGVVKRKESPNNKWVNKLWDASMNNTWFPQEANVSKDKANYKKLSDMEKRAYDLVLAQLIANDSIQTINISENIAPLITDPAVAHLLSRHSFEEALHTSSYEVMIEDVGMDSDAIYDMHKKDDMLLKKNLSIRELFMSLDKPNINEVDFALLSLANNILESPVFFGGFTTLWSMGDTMQGTAKMISFISRDELVHLEIFKNIFRTHVSEQKIDFDKYIRKPAEKMIRGFIEVEKEWIKYVTKCKIPGFSESSIDSYVESKGNDVAKNCLLGEIYKKNNSPLKKIESDYKNPNAIKTNFFESEVTNYKRGELDMEGF